MIVRIPHDGRHIVPDTGTGPIAALDTRLPAAGDAAFSALLGSVRTTVREPGIPINIRNTNAPEEDGTLILPDRESDHPVCGVAGRKGFTMINIEKTLMNKELGFGRRVLGIFEQHGVGFEHMPTGIDTMSVIVRDEELGRHGQAIVEDIERTCQPEGIITSSCLVVKCLDVECGGFFTIVGTSHPSNSSNGSPSARMPAESIS